MRKRKFVRIIFISFIVIILCAASYLLYDRGRPAPIPTKQELYEGVIYRRVVQFIPRPMIAHIIKIDMKANGMELFITPPDSEGEAPLNARTTSQFLDEFNVQIAINGDGFSPWWSHSPADYYPHVGDPVAPLGLSASNGEVYSTGVQTPIGIKPTLYVSRRNVLSFNNPPNNIHSAISGDRMIVIKGEIAPGLSDREMEPRTAIGINRNGRYLYLIVVDGRQPFYSSGATFVKLAQILIDQGAYVAMSLDGGGSSTLVIEGEAGQPIILNSPIDNYIPGRERPVGNHLGIYVK